MTCVRIEREAEGGKERERGWNGTEKGLSKGDDIAPLPRLVSTPIAYR